MAFTISVDTGGTFTDVIVRDQDGTQTIGKALTTHGRVFEGLSESIRSAAAQLGLNLEQLLAHTTLLIYGTTRATNAIVTRNVAKTAFLTTEGFPDILVLKEGGKLDGYDFTKPYPAPYIPRRRTFEIPERIDAEGNVAIELNEGAVREILHTLRDRKFEAVAVCLLWSFLNPAHELAVGRLIEEIMPGIPYTLSHQLAPIIREYRRASATAIDASLKPCERMMPWGVNFSDSMTKTNSSAGRPASLRSISGAMWLTGPGPRFIEPSTFSSSTPAAAQISISRSSLQLRSWKMRFTVGSETPMRSASSR